MIVALIHSACVGCGRGPQAPYAKGRWTGTLVSLTVRTSDGQEYKAAGLRTESGPGVLRSPYGNTISRVTPGDVAILGRDGLIIPPVNLGIPMGAAVAARGLMMHSSLGITTTNAFGFEHYRPVFPGRLTLYLRGDPKPIGG